MKSKLNATKIIEIIKSHNGIERKQICAALDMTNAQFQGAQMYITKYCWYEAKKWRMTIVETVPPRIRKSSTATIVYKMMPVSQRGLKEKLGMHKDAVWRALTLLKSHSLIHITGYETSHTTIYPIFAAGMGVDAIRPDGKTLANRRSNKYKAKNSEVVREKHRVYREKNNELLKEKGRARYAAKADTLNAMARAKRAELKEMPKGVPKPIATQWQTVSPWAALTL